ncbi:MAG: hypothetical protein NZ957_05605 [Thaumarchaeota archaeon]|nr:hypothetical protein [Candidatus Calditenuaceae archaeon]MDW8041486.1 hypothetical protein [Nitrososphaerota archaeon]
MRELTAYLVKTGLGAVTGAASAYVSVVAHWALTIPFAAAVYLAITYAMMGAVQRDNPHLSGRRRWTLAVGAYSTIWLMCWLLVYNLIA